MMVNILLVFCVLLIAGFFSHSFFLNKSKKHNIKKANVTGVRFKSQSKPISGGITFFISFAITSVIYLFFFYENGTFEHQALGIGIVITLSFLMGLADDIIDTSPYFKFFIQFLSGFILVKSGVYIDIFPDLYLNYIITVLWVVGIMNSINMLDNMDAITTLVIITILAGLGINLYLFNEYIDPIIIFFVTGLLAALISFIYFNWPQAKMYMGDNGSQVLGSFVASLSIILLWNNTESTCVCAIPKQALAVVLAFLIPITDTATVTINRLMKGKSPFVGGKDHTTHHLFYRFKSEKTVALIYLFISAFSVFLSVYILNFTEKLGDVWTVVLWVYAAVVFLLLYINTRITKSN